MPKILINEKDRTSPGTPDSYSNYAVLIAGFKGTNVSDDIGPDTNGVYEFSSAEDFKNTIGLVAPKNEVDGKRTFYHYGNQMAYELLNMGYPIVYAPIDNIDDLASESFWEIFKDKASYDFRFITHGLLESSDLEDPDSYKEFISYRNDIKEAIKELDKIDADADKKIAQDTDNKYEKAVLQEEAFDLISGNYNGFKLKVLLETTGEGEDATQELVVETMAIPYSSYDEARAALGTSLEDSEALSLVNSQIASFTNGGIGEDLIYTANGIIADLAKYSADDVNSKGLPGRGDCIALIEVDEKAYINSTVKPENLIINAINKMAKIDKANGAYCAMTVPSVVYNIADYSIVGKDQKGNDIRDFDNNKKFPGAFHYLACFKNSLQQGFAEWYAAAGYTRGVSSYRIDYTTVKLGEIAINALEPRNTDGSEGSPKFACNVIANFRGSYYLWGNRTAYELGDVKGSSGDLVASHFLNIRQLCTTIKKQLYVACRRFTFDPNSDTLWFNFVNAIKPTLEAMKADQGIRDYKIIKEYTDKKATLKAKIRIIPIEAVEDFELEVSLEDSFGETTAVVSE